MTACPADLPSNHRYGKNCCCHGGCCWSHCRSLPRWTGCLPEGAYWVKKPDSPKKRPTYKAIMPVNCEGMNSKCAEDEFCMLSGVHQWGTLNYRCAKKLAPGSVCQVMFLYCELQLYIDKWIVVDKWRGDILSKRFWGCNTRFFPLRMTPGAGRKQNALLGIIVFINARMEDAAVTWTRSTLKRKIVATHIRSNSNAPAIWSVSQDILCAFQRTLNGTASQIAILATAAKMSFRVRIRNIQFL